MVVSWQVGPRSRSERLTRAPRLLADEEKLFACSPDRTAEETGGRRRPFRPLVASFLLVCLCVSSVAFAGSCDHTQPLCGPRVARICDWTRTRDPRAPFPRPQRAHGGSVPAAVMAVAAAFTPRITHPSHHSPLAGDCSPSSSPRRAIFGAFVAQSG